MNEVIEKENIKIEDMIYEIRGVQVMLDSEISATKCHDYICDDVVTHYDIVKTISILINFADSSAKLGRNLKLW